MSLKTVYLLSFLDAFNLALAIPVLNLHVVALGGSFILCGILQSIGAGMQLFTSPIIGSWSDTYGRKSVLLCTLTIIFLGDAIAGMDSLKLFFVGRILYGIAHHTDPLLKATVTDMVPDKQRQTQVLHNLIALPGLAFLVAPVIGGFLYQRFSSFSIISSILCTIDVILIGIVYMFVPKIQQEKTTEIKSERNWNKFLDLLLVKFLVESAFNFLFMNSGLILSKMYFFSRMQIGFCITYMSATMMVGALLSPVIKKRFYNSDMTGSRRIVHALLLMAVTFAILLAVSNPILYLAVYIPASVAKFLLEVAWMEALTARSNESEKGFTMGIATSMISAAGLVCPLISGSLADYVGVNILPSLPLLPAVIGVFFATKIKKPHTQ